MTRFRIVMRHKLRVAYDIHLENIETAISVKRPPLLSSLVRNKLMWTWLDGTEYVLDVPTWRGPFTTSSWHIASGGRNVSSGCLGTPSFLGIFSRRASTHFVWDSDGEVVLSETRFACFGVNVLRRQRDGKRLACWHYKSGWGLVAEGICRDSLPKEKFPVILGMILTEMGEQCAGSGGGGD